MISAIKKLFDRKPQEDLGVLILGGATIIDVRTSVEFASGHLEKSVNIPLNSLHIQLSKLKKDQVIITCCASGMRSSSAKSILQSNGFTKVYNGGSWYNLKKYE